MKDHRKASIKRGKPSYFMSILGVTLVLILLGIIGIITINSRKLIQNLKESVEVHIFLKQNIRDADRIALQKEISSKQYVKTIKYTDKESARREWINSGGEDFTELIDNNILPTSIDFTLKEKYVDSVNLESIKNQFSSHPIVSEVRYPKAVVVSMTRNFKTIQLILGIVALIMVVLAIILIDNTIRLAMFSNRFLIKTMQMVGATRGFISRPLTTKAFINGALSGLIATTAIWVMMILSETYFDGFKKLHDTYKMIMLGVVLAIIGMAITWFSTYRSIIKYLKMKLDDLY